MELNLTIENGLGFLAMAVIAAAVLKGWFLVRALGWLFLWQLLSPVRNVLLDFPLMLIGLGLLEYAYLQLTSKGGRCGNA